MALKYNGMSFSNSVVEFLQVLLLMACRRVILFFEKKKICHGSLFIEFIKITPYPKKIKPNHFYDFRFCMQWCKKKIHFVPKEQAFIIKKKKLLKATVVWSNVLSVLVGYGLLSLSLSLPSHPRPIGSSPF